MLLRIVNIKQDLEYRVQCYKCSAILVITFSERVPENVEPLLRFDASAFEFAERAVGVLRQRGARFEPGGAEYVFVFQPDADVPDVERDGECFPHDSRPSPYLQKLR